jgi:chromosomal replication initiator protein
MRAWEQFLSTLEEELGKGPVQEWLRPLKLVRFDAANIYLGPADSFQTSWFEEHVRPKLKDRLCNNNGRTIEVHLLTTDAVKDKGRLEAPPRLSLIPDALDPHLTFENFLAHTENLIAQKLLSETSCSFNPIFLYGPKGSGKTHLLTAAAHAWKANGKRVFFAKAEKFTEHVVQAIRLNLMQEFRRAYREIDVLIIDDIHIFSKKTATQEEFFHTFNTLHTAGLQIVLSANAAPSHLSEIEPRLISRFEWGIPIALSKPPIDQVLAKKAALWNMDLPPSLSSFLLESFSDPLVALQALALRAKQTPTLDGAKKLLIDLLEKEKQVLITPETLLKEIAGRYGVKTEDLLGKSQTREHVLPRQIAMFLCRNQLKMAYQKIGELFGRDHSTVMSSVKLVQKGIDEKKILIS